MAENKPKFKQIPGTKFTQNNTQLVISCGIPSLDDLIGGGLAVGTVFLIEEDVCATYAKVILRYFLAEGAVNGHNLYVGTNDCDPTSFIKSLPSVVSNLIENAPNVDISDDKLTIAWRYQHMKVQDVKTLPTFGHNYDLTMMMDQKIIDETDVTYWKETDKSEKVPETTAFKNPAFHNLLQNIKKIIEEKKLGLTAQPDKRNILRVALYSIGSPMWLPDDECDDAYKRDLALFLYCLRAVARNAFAVIAISIPSKILPKACVSRCIYSSDLAVRLQAFAGTELEKNPALTDYQGYFQFVKFPAINCLKSADPGPVDFAFKMRRRKFEIQLLHLPPALEEAKQDEIPSMSCGSSSKHLLEF